jgi:lipopolysaccharide transport system permease protein
MTARAAAAEGGAERVEVVIRPQKTFRTNWTELWAYRELFYFFVWRDVKVRYKQTAIGAAWVIFQPFITRIVFTVFFNKIAGVQAPDGIPYAIFSYAGLMFWTFFSTSLTNAANSLVSSQALISKIYFPRLIAPFSAILVGLVDFCFTSLIYVGLFAYYGIAPGITGVLLVLPMLLLTLVGAAGPGLFLAAVNVRYRDVRFVVPFVINLLLFLTPIIYPVSLVPERWRFALYFNPVTGAIQTIRAEMLHEGTMQWGMLGISVASALVMFVFGFIYFRNHERRFADII